MSRRCDPTLLDGQPVARDWAERLGHALRGESVRRLAAAANVSHPTIHAMLRGEAECWTQVVRFDTLLRLNGYELVVRKLESPRST